jgi:hypothetical protein
MTDLFKEYDEATQRLMKAMTSRNVKVKCIKHEDLWNVFEQGKEYDAFYRGPDLILTHSDFSISDGKMMYHFDWNDFHRYFEILDEDFDGIEKIELQFG